jgi:hypothetical protein
MVPRAHDGCGLSLNGLCGALGAEVADEELVGKLVEVARLDVAVGDALLGREPRQRRRERHRRLNHPF